MLISKIKPYIELSPYSRDEVRKVMGVSNNTISLWCTGKSRPNLEDAFKLSRLLGVTVEDIYEYREENTDD
jgi:DNA-binding XRE family transcriptional regulator